MTFKELKTLLIDKATAENACYEGLLEGYEVKNKNELLQVIKKHYAWLDVKGLFGAEFLEKHFTKKQLIVNGIYTSGYHNVDYITGKIIVCGDAQLIGIMKAATVKCFNKSKIEVDGCGLAVLHNNTYGLIHGVIWVVANEESQVKALNHCIVEAKNVSTVTSYDNAQIHAYNNSMVHAFDHSIVKMCNESQVIAHNYTFVENHTEHNPVIKNIGVIVRNMKDLTIMAQEDVMLYKRNHINYVKI
jgi:hypothetical protein